MRWFISKRRSTVEVTHVFVSLNAFHRSSNVDLEQMPVIFNQLLALLKHIIQTYRLIDSVDVLEYAAKLIHLLQGSSSLQPFVIVVSVDLHVSDKTKYNPEPFSQAIDQLALCLTAR